MEKLEKKGYVDSHGKSGAVYSLSFQGVAYVKGTPWNRVLTEMAAYFDTCDFHF
jgi:DNA-binding PadR family transcriptional regulator